MRPKIIIFFLGLFVVATVVGLVYFESPANQPPVAVNDTAITSENTAVDIAVLANDTDPDNDPLTVASVTQGASGTVAINPDNTVKYTPNAGFLGTDTFTYTASDGKGGIDTATVAVTISLAPAAPTITWTSSQVVETVAHGQTKTTTVSFTSSESLTNVVVFIVPELSLYMSAAPSSFSSISVETPTTLMLTITAPIEAPLGTFEGMLHLKDNGGKTYINALPVKLIIYATDDPEETLGELISDLRADNVEAALQKLDTSSQDQGKLKTLDSDALNKLADSLENRTLIETTPTLRVYIGPWVDENGIQRDVEFTMALNSLGEWKIISW